MGYIDSLDASAWLNSLKSNDGGDAGESSRQMGE